MSALLPSVTRLRCKIEWRFTAKKPCGCFAIADGLRTIGLRPQSRVAILGRKGDHVFWARVARVHIIDQIPDPDAFLHADPTVQMKVLAALERTGAEALVCDEWSASHPGLEWQRLGNSRYYALPLGGYRQSQPSR